MKTGLIVVFLSLASVLGAQTIDVKAFKWNLSSDTISVKNIDPSDVYMALLSKGVINEPLYRDNESSLQWVAHHDWTFETEFPVADIVLLKDRIELVLEGLDTYASVFLNNRQVLQADNMFRRWVVEVKPFLKRQNSLKIIFRSPYKIIAKGRKEGAWPVPCDYGFVRKASYHFGWDWGPTFITSGIWRSAYIRAWNKARFKDVYIHQKSITKSKVEVEVNVTMDASQKGKGSMLLFRDGVLIQKRNVMLHLGENSFQIADVENNPELWWPNGMGEPTMYSYKVLYQSEGVLVDSMEVQTGFRTIEVIQKPDSIGRSFYFKVNGVPVFAKGANYIPPDNFLPRVSDAKYRQVIEGVKKANMNMLRVWGGGTYEKDIFYRLCDENGIMVWQDFMFAGDMVPGDSAFVENVKREAEDNVIRLRNHPSIVLWCGNNEIDEAWHNWGWQKQYNYSKEDSVRLWKAYLEIFENILPEVIHHKSPGTFYWPSSPSIGWGHQEAYRQGDVHYWEVWWGRAPFVNYEKKIGRFMSEYGFQGMPDMKTINDFTLPQDRVMGSKVLDVHQKHPFGWETINEYMKRDYPIPTTLEDYDYVSQLLQAEGVGMAIEAHRRAKPYCMGTLYWQLNDCWPVVSWSSVDYYGRWKALHYKVKRDYASTIVSFDKTKDSIRIWVVNDDMKSEKAILSWRLMDFSGRILKEDNKQVELKSNDSQIMLSITDSLIEVHDTSSVFICARLKSSNDSLISESNYFFVKPKDLRLTKPVITTILKKQGDGYLVLLNSKFLAKDVHLSTSENGFFEDNYFDLLPGEGKRVFFRTRNNISLVDIQVKSLYDVMEH